jgi:DNA-binding transcriptional LysR family regulator
MELRELKTFCTAARFRSISKAADYLGIGQPTASTHVRKLERELGMVLFDRVKRPIQLTLAGTSLVELAAPLIEGIDALAASTSHAEEVGPVSVASTHDIIPHTLLQVVQAFRSLYPKVHLRIRSGTSPEVLNMVAEGEADIGIVPGPARGAGFDFQALFGYERVVITPLGHPLLEAPLTSLDQIVQWPLILMGPHTATRTMLENEFHRRGLSYDVIVELDSMDIIKRYVSLGVGVSIGPRLAIEPDDYDELGILSLANLLPVEQAGIVTLRGKTLSRPAGNFVSVAVDVLTATPSRR